MIIQIPVGQMQNFAYIIADEKTKDAALIDPGFDYKKILAEAEKHSLKIKKILLTHAHFDHVTDLPKIAEETKAEVFIHEDEPLDIKIKTTKLKDNQTIERRPSLKILR